jgi:hypothetical protein
MTYAQHENAQLRDSPCPGAVFPTVSPRIGWGGYGPVPSPAVFSW